MLIHRLGMTETAIMICMFASENNIGHQNEIQKHFIMWMNWLYSTCGYYDKKVSGTYFNFNKDALTENYLTYIKLIKKSLENSDRIYFMLHHNSMHEHIYFSFTDKINSWLGTKTEYCIITSKINPSIINEKKEDRLNVIYNSIKNKNILIVSPFGELIQQQILNGNAYTANEKLPNVLNIDYITPPYCFGNNGPKNNALETLEDLWNNIKEKNFDIALLSCGSYGHALCSRISKLLNKDAIYVGGELSRIFGILDKRNKEKFTLQLDGKKDIDEICHITSYKINKMIEVPEKYRPKNYKSIENGCYW